MLGGGDVGADKTREHRKKKKKNPKTKQKEEIQDRQVASDRKWPRRVVVCQGRKRTGF